ncbi:MAG: nucleotide sugar dehydrogenase [Sulfuritalea sp.]|nr:nucleotide sugar dehydrogenase [Sulfuritalea sp.]MCF8184246.1 nucleotide sugar dehydrogenase [Polynucleobacter sp.]
MITNSNTTIAVVGLGYVGLPLAVEFGKQFKTIGYDLSEAKVAAYKEFRDPTGEVSSDDLRAAMKLGYTTDPSSIANADYIVVAVPTPIDQAHQPDFSPLVSSSASVGTHMKRGAIVIYESTVYPGATEEICIPVLEKHSGLKWQQDFHVGYSPERINPGDKEHTLTKILKVVAGDDADTLDKVAQLYESVVTAGVHRASSIKVAEAAKVIENTQRDLNIALMNELALVFDKLGIDTSEVLEAAGTKWNFLKFRPGLVGGHCIGVDPYYLTHKADMLGYHPQVILAGRRINDGMGKFIAEKTLKLMIRAGLSLKGARVNVLGLTFKENCPDLRNSRVPDIINELKSYGLDIHVHDPLAVTEEALHEYGLNLEKWEELPRAEALIVAVAHREYGDMPLKSLVSRVQAAGVVIDVKSGLDLPTLKAMGYACWRL